MNPLVVGSNPTGPSSSVGGAFCKLGQVGADGRLYGLNKNEQGKSTVYGLMKSLPAYDEVRSRVIAAVIDAVEGKPIPTFGLQ